MSFSNINITTNTGLAIKANDFVLMSAAGGVTTSTTTTTTTAPTTTSTTTTTTTVAFETFTVRTENAVLPTNICSNPTFTVYAASGSVFAGTTKLYTDSALTTSLVIAGGNNAYISELLSATIWNYNNVLGEIGSNTGNSC